MKKFNKLHIPFLVLFFIVYLLIPHFVMNLPLFDELDPLTWNRELMGYTLVEIYYFCVWIGVPLLGSAIALLHALVVKEFCPLLIVEASVCILTYFTKIPVSHVLLLLSSVIVVLAIEASTLLKQWQSCKNCKMQSFLSQLSLNREYLAVVFFWSIGIIATVQISYGYINQWKIYSPENIFLLLSPVMLVLPFFHAFEHPLTESGFTAIVIIFAVSCIQVTALMLTTKSYAHLVHILLAFILLLISEGIYHLLYKACTRNNCNSTGNH